MRTKARGIEDGVVTGIVFLIGVGTVVSIIYPFWATLVVSFSGTRFANIPGFHLLPLEPSLSAYGNVLSKSIVGVAYLNSIFRTVVGTALTLVITLGAAYGLSKRKLPFRRALTGMVIFTMFFSGGLIPTYLLVKNLGLLNTRFALILPFLVSPFSLLVMRNFMYSIPVELEESAFIDGANEVLILVRIVVPLSLPIIATIALWTAVMHWNDWFYALIYDRKTQQTVLQVLLRRVVIENQPSDVYGQSYDDANATVTEETVKAATLFVSIGPVILIYPFIQKYFVKGVMVGALKQ